MSTIDLDAAGLLGRPGRPRRPRAGAGAAGAARTGGARAAGVGGPSAAVQQGASAAAQQGANAGARGLHAAPTAGSYPAWLLLVGVLCLVGLVMVLSASAVASLRQYGSPWHYFERQVLWLGVGAGAFSAALRLGPTGVRRLGRPAMLVTFALLAAVLVPGVGVRVAGATRWLGTASLQLQPSEMAKLALVLFAADVLDRRAGRGSWRYQMGPVLVAVGGLAMAVMLQPDMGTTMVLTCIGLAMLYTAGLPAKPLLGVLAGGVALSGLLAVAAPYRVRRLTSFLHPLHDASNTGYQAVQGLAAMGHGSLLGDGLGASISSWGYLPNAQTDFIFAVIGEEMGLVGTLAVTALFAALAVVGTRIACRCEDRHAALVTAGVTAWLVSQAVINIGAVVGLLPVTGVPLPFVSFGGSSMVIALVGVGLVAHAARQA